MKKIFSNLNPFKSSQSNSSNQENQDQADDGTFAESGGPIATLQPDREIGGEGASDPDDSLNMEDGNRQSLLLSMIPVLFLIVSLSGTVIIFGDEATSGPSQMALILSGFVAAFIAWRQGFSWSHLERRFLRNMSIVTQAVMILLLVGSLIGTWILGGIVPTLIVWGLKVISPAFFLLSALLISSLVSLTTGSSWSTVGTIGLALIGVGNTLGISPGMSAGAIISGAYFGDKLSPFSETTNLASSMVGVDLFAHIRHMLYTTVPGYLIAALFYLVLGQSLDAGKFDASRIENIIRAIEGNFNTEIYVLLFVVLLFVMIALKVPAIPALFIGTLFGILSAVLFQQEMLLRMAEQSKDSLYHYTLAQSFKVSSQGFKSTLGIKEVDELLSRGGMVSMLNTIWLIISSMFFSGIMEGAGMLQRIAIAILNWVKSRGQLISATLGTAIFMNVTASEQYLSIIVTGRMYENAYAKQGLHPKNLSRSLEDAGTLTSALVPWNTCGAFMASTLNVATFTYAPYAVLNWVNPIISAIYGFTGYTIVNLRRREQKDHAPSKENPES